MTGTGDFAGRVCVVSGVGPGVGRAAAMIFAREGASVVVAARNGEYLEGVVGELEGLGAEAAAVPADVSKPDDCARIVDRACELYGGLDVLVNNAASTTTAYAKVDEVELDEWRRQLDVNLYGSLRVTQRAIPELRKRGGGAVVFVNTMMIRKVRSYQGGYAATKNALLTASQVLAREVGPDGIRVNSVLPGWIWGESVQRFAASTAKRKGITVDEAYADLAANTALRRLPTPEDIAEAICFLASDRAGCITGQTLDVNGGEVFG